MDREWKMQHFVPFIWNLHGGTNGQLILEVLVHEMRRVKYSRGADGKFRINYDVEHFNPFNEFCKIIPVEGEPPIRNSPIPCLIRTNETNEEAIEEKMDAYQSQSAPVRPYREFITKEEQTKIGGLLRAPPHHSMLIPWMNEYVKQYAVLQMCYLDPLRIACFLHNVMIFLHPKYGMVQDTAQLLGNMYLYGHAKIPFPAPGPTEAYREYIGAVVTDMAKMQMQMVESDDPPRVVATALHAFMKKRNMMNPCHECGAVNAPQYCKRCGVARYCGKECQTQHYKLHASWCKDNALIKTAQPQE